jgi:YVTN family beta-propeller protein
MSRLRLWTYVLLLASAATAILLVVSYTQSGDASVFAKSQEQQSSTKNERDDTGDDHRHGQLSSTGSSPIAITAHNKFVWSVNPDNNSISVFFVAKDANKKIAEIPVGEEPWCVAIQQHRREHDFDHGSKKNDDDDGKVIVTNMVSGTVSVIDSRQQKVADTIPVGHEPFGCALTPDGEKLYLANQSSESVSVIDTERVPRAMDAHRFDDVRQDVS